MRTALLLTLLLTLPAAAQDPSADPLGEEERVSAELVSEQEGLKVGLNWVGVTLRIVPDWHVYWLNPGDAGVPTTVEVKGLPKGVTHRIRWPAPKRLAHDGLVDFVYEDEVTILIPLRVTKEVALGSKIALDVKVTWLVCKDVCVIGAARLKRTLKVVSGPGKVRPEDKKAIALSRARLATPAPKDLEVAWSGAKLNLRVPGAQRLAWFPALPTESSPDLSLVEAKGERLTLTYPARVKSAKRVTGLLALTRKGRTTFHWIQARVQKVGKGS
jgi:DsbC/DsbD-like thiol-disulfide interchange protein